MAHPVLRGVNQVVWAIAMTKAELLAFLEPLPDDQYIFVRMHRSPHERCQLAIQGLTLSPPWHEAAHDTSNWLVGIDVHPTNATLPADATGKLAEVQSLINVGAKERLIAQMEAEFQQQLRKVFDDTKPTPPPTKLTKMDPNYESTRPT